MTATAGARRSNALFILAAALLGLGLVVDLGFTRPRLEEIRSLEAARARLHLRRDQRGAREREAKELARLLGADDLASAVSAGQGEDPVDFLGHALERWQLERVQLTTRSSTSAGPLRQTGYTLKVEGSYGGILNFVRSVEMGPRVVTVDAISMVPGTGSAALEAELDLTLYEAAGNQP